MKELNAYHRVSQSPAWNQLCPEWYINPDEPPPAKAWQFNVSKSQADLNEPVTFTARLLERETPLLGLDAVVTLQRDFHPDETWHATTSEDGIQITTSLEQPGFLRVSVTAGGVTGAYGAGVQVHDILPAPEVHDFQQYWDGRLQALRQSPMKVLDCHRVHPAEEKDYPGVATYEVSVSCVGDIPVAALLCLPEHAAPHSLPAYAFFHGAGIRPPFPPLPWAAKGFLALNISAMGIPWSLSPEQLSATTKRLRGYEASHALNPLDNPFDGMALRVLRSLEFLKSRPEWNHRILVSHGGSQGGWQTLVASAFDPDLSFAMIEAPAQCNNGGIIQRRTPGWPWVLQRFCPDDQLSHTHRLFDGAAFARRGHAPAIFTVGYSDAAAPPASVYAAYNVYPAEKALVPFFDLGHNADVFWGGEDPILAHANS